MIDFPASPATGQTFSAAGVTWTFDGVKWAPFGMNVAYLPLTGGQLSGPLDGPSATFTDATIDNLSAPQAIGTNRLQNGDMRIDQRNGTGRSNNANNYVVDRWYYYGQNTSLTWQQGNAGSGAPILGRFPYWVGIACNTAYTPAAGDIFEFYQAIEADQISDLAFGTANAQTITLSFLAYATTPGTYSGSIYNAGGTRTYPFTFSIPTATTWTPISITIPGDTAGTWATSGNGIGLYLIFDLGCGSSRRGPANAWASGSYVGVTGAVSLVTILNAQFAITGVKLEVGSVATPFAHESLEKSLADCQRYYERSGNPGAGFGVIGGSHFIYTSGSGIGNGGATSFFKVTKRANPTVNIYSAGTGAPNMIYDQNASADVAATLFTLGQSDFGWYGAATAATGINFAIQWTASADF